MKFTINPHIFETFPGLTVGVVVASNLTNKGESQEINELIRHEEERIKNSFSLETLSQQPAIEAWRKAYQAFGAKPKDHRSSVENLYRLVLQGASLRHINMLVDIYNVTSLTYMLPVGGEDLDTMKGDIQLTLASANETPITLLGDKEQRAPHKGEVIYKDEISTICRRWNWREADRTKLTEQTTHAILVIEGLPPTTQETIEVATHALANHITRYCKGEVVSHILNQQYASITVK